MAESCEENDGVARRMMCQFDNEVIGECENVIDPKFKNLH